MPYNVTISQRSNRSRGETAGSAKGPPEDPGTPLRPIERLVRSRRFRQELSRRLRLSGRAGEGWRLTTLKAHKDRCTFRAVPRGAGEPVGWVVKVHREAWPHVFEVMRAIERAGFGRHESDAIAHPVAYLPRYRALVEEWIDGVPAMVELVAGDAVERASASARCGRWLARFHSIDLNATPSSPGPRVGSFARLWARQLAQAGGPLEDRSAALLRRWERSAARSRPEVGPVHGSYLPEHVLFADRRTVVIDLDEAGVGDPALDVASFVVALWRIGLKRAGSTSASAPAVGAFLREYARVRGGIPRNLPVFMAEECLHRAWHDLYKRVPGADAWAAATLELGWAARPG